MVFNAIVGFKLYFNLLFEKIIMQFTKKDYYYIFYGDHLNIQGYVNLQFTLTKNNTIHNLVGQLCVIKK